ncbi:hypothetical protein EBR96_08755, partial [bacterium]|nr:hypothetical protein [bacterium]
MDKVRVAALKIGLAVVIMFAGLCCMGVGVAATDIVKLMTTPAFRDAGRLSLSEDVHGIALDPNGNAYTLRNVEGGKWLRRYGPDGTFPEEEGTIQLNTDSNAIYVRGNHVYVVEGNDLQARFTSNFDIDYDILSEGKITGVHHTEDGDLTVQKIFVDVGGSVYLLKSNGSIFRYTAWAEELIQFSAGTGADGGAPIAIAGDDDDTSRIYVLYSDGTIYRFFVSNGSKDNGMDDIQAPGSKSLFVDYSGIYTAIEKLGGPDITDARYIGHPELYRSDFISSGEGAKGASKFNLAGQEMFRFDVSYLNFSDVPFSFGRGQVWHFGSYLYMFDDGTGAGTNTVRKYWVGPSRITSVSAVTSGNSIIINWNNPADLEYAGVEIRRSTTGYPQTPTAGTGVITGALGPFTNGRLSEGTYYYTLFSQDAQGTYSDAVTVSATLDFTPPSAPTHFVAGAHSNTINLSWTNPLSDFSSVIIRRSTSGYPASRNEGVLVTQNTAVSSYADVVADGQYFYS